MTNSYNHKDIKDVSYTFRTCDIGAKESFTQRDETVVQTNDRINTINTENDCVRNTPYSNVLLCGLGKTSAFTNITRVLPHYLLQKFAAMNAIRNV